jgi:hypothetical protein
VGPKNCDWQVSGNSEQEIMPKKSRLPGEPDKAQIAIEGADQLYRELRVENKLTAGNGPEVQLKQGDKVEVTVEAKSPSSIRRTEM